MRKNRATPRLDRIRINAMAIRDFMAGNVEAKCDCNADV
jgi:hypothetical protein